MIPLLLAMIFALHIICPGSGLKQFGPEYGTNAVEAAETGRTADSTEAPETGKTTGNAEAPEAGTTTGNVEAPEAGKTTGNVEAP